MFFVVSGEASRKGGQRMQSSKVFFLTLKRSCTPKWRLLHQQRSWPEPHSGTRGQHSPPCWSVPTRPGETRERRSAVCFGGVCVCSPVCSLCRERKPTRHLLVVAADVVAGVAPVVVVAFLLHPAPNGPRCVEQRCRVACPYVFTHRGEGGGDAASARQIGVVLRRAFSGPLLCARG